MFFLHVNNKFISHSLKKLLLVFGLLKSYSRKKLSCVEHDQTLCPLLVHDTIAALTATDWIARLHLVVAVTFWKDSMRF